MRVCIVMQNIYLDMPLDSDKRLEDGPAMNHTSFLGVFVATVTWIPIRNYTSAERGEVRDHKASRTAPTELYIPLH
jgi:hypothetical protein